MVDKFARTALTKYLRLGGLNYGTNCPTVLEAGSPR